MYYNLNHINVNFYYNIYKININIIIIIIINYKYDV